MATNPARGLLGQTPTIQRLRLDSAFGAFLIRNTSLQSFLFLPLALGLILSFATNARAGLEGEGRSKTLFAHRILKPPTMDGSLRDAVWQDIAPDDRFRQIFPADGAAPSMRTTVRVAFDDDNLYFGIEALDPEPSKISARLARRDSRIDADYIELFLDTRHNHDSGYWFRVNAAGVLADAELHDDFRSNFDWDAVWTAETAIGERGWSVEISIPLSVLRFSSAESPVFGFDLKRGIRRLGEIDTWIYTPRTSSGTLSRAGHLRGLEGLRPRRVVELRPFAVAQMGSSLSAGGSTLLGHGKREPGFSAGLDAKLGVSEGLTLDATVNPDFGQVEADPVVLNLSSFETFFPEKRPFFLEGSGLFGTDIRLIHSRRIGERTTKFRAGSSVSTGEGESQQVRSAPLAVPTYGALRLSGRLGSRISLNVLSAITGPERVTLDDGRDLSVAAPKNYSAMRAKYSLGGSSYLGLVATGVTRLGESLEPQSNHDSYAESVDGRWVRADGMYRAYFQFAASHRVGGDRFEQRDCTSSQTCRPLARLDGTLIGPGDPGSAGEIGVAKAAGALRVYSRYRWVSPRFEVDGLGFENNWDYHEGLARISYQHEENFLWFERAQAALTARSRFAFNGIRKTLTLRAELSALSKNFWRGSAKLVYKPPGSFTSRETLDGAFFENSDEIFGGFDLSSDSRKDISIGAGADYLTSPSTELRKLGAYAYLSLRPTPPLEIKFQTNLARRSGELRAVSCATSEGRCWRNSSVRDYTLALQDSKSLNVTARVNWALSPNLSFEGYSQLFAAGGEYRKYRSILGATGATPKLSRTMGMPIMTPVGDSGRFSFATLNINLVTRWEMKPGTTLIAVYTRAQKHRRERNRLALSGLRSSPGEEVFLLKFSYFYNL